MTNPSFNPDDPRLTAFVLGELDDVDRDAVEQLREASPEARAFVDDLQDTIGVLRDELSAEPAPALTDDQRAALQHAAATVESRAGTTQRGAASTTHSRRGILFGTAATIAVLGIVVAALPQFADHRSSDSGDFASLASRELSDETLSIAAADGNAQTEQAKDAVIGARVANMSGPAQLTSRDDGPDHRDSLRSTRLPLKSTSPRSLLTVNEERSASAGGLKANVGRQRIQDQPGPPTVRSIGQSVATTSEPQAASGRVESRGGFATLNSELAEKTKTRPAEAGDADQADGLGAFGSGGRSTSAGVAGKSRLLPARPTQTAGTKSELAKTGQPAVTQPDSTASGNGSPAPPSPVSESARRFTPGVAGPVRGRTLQTADNPKPAPRLPLVTTEAAGATVAESLGESESRRRVLSGGTQRIFRESPDFIPQPQKNLGVLSSGFGAAGNETYEPIVENEFVVPDPKNADKRLSTISVDVDTASYANMRRFLMQDRLPPANAVRIEELVNYFKYDYPQPKGDDPFSVTTEIMLCPWQPGHRLARIGLQAKTIDKSQRPSTNLVFLLDVSGSMRPANKLPLVQQAMRLLVEEMTEDDQIAIVTYASNAGLRLVSTPGSKKPEILQSIDSLTAGGSTNGEGGIKLAYDTAVRHYIQDGANRVILCTDGDFNVGVSNDNELVELIQEKAASGVFLSVFGFGMGNLKDGKLEKLADKGNGQYGYIDNLQEARRAFSEDLAGTLYTVAKDVKLQAEFNPATVGAYRLIGYENRKLAAADFTDDTKDAGEIGAGHTVTALYEIVPRQVLVDRLNSDEFRYTGSFDVPAEAPKVDGFSDELFFVRLRYKQPDQETSEEVPADFPVNDIVISGKPVAAPSADFQFAAAVASFGMNLRNSQYRGKWDLRHVYNAAVQTRGEDADGRRAEFVDLIQRTMRIAGQQLGIDLEKLPVSERPAELSAAEARIKAAVDGKYRRLLKKIEVRDDLQQYGAFHDFGFWDKSSEYKGHSDLLPGYWVYVYPNWYIWGEADASRLPKPESKPGDASAASTPDAKEKTDAQVLAEKQ